jgi:hypothetical protein
MVGGRGMVAMGPWWTIVGWLNCDNNRGEINTIQYDRNMVGTILLKNFADL